ncbi:MAG: hypothetical protein VYD27_01000 [Candidatus Thermoplasmatota archaeon]|nr:hypothetical protein [Candidatus Thermoplasmatota archaeon]
MAEDQAPTDDGDGAVEPASEEGNPPPPPPPGFDSPPPHPPEFPLPDESSADSKHDEKADGIIDAKTSSELESEQDEQSDDLAEPETLVEEGEENTPPPLPESFDIHIDIGGQTTPPPPPLGFEGPSSDFSDPEDEETNDQEVRTNNEDEILSIDSLAESLSLLSGDWPSSDEENADEPNDITHSDAAESEIDSVAPFSWIQEEEREEENSEVAQAIDSFGIVKESEQPQLATDSQSRPSPFLRQSTEVDSIPGDKLHATLSETEKAVLNPDGSVRKQFIDGELILRNSSKKHRAWDIDVHLESIESTDFSDKLSSVKELDPTEETAIPYTASGPRMLILKENIDTEATRAEETSLSLVHSDTPQDVDIEIQIENVSPVALYDVEVKRTIPESFILPDDRVYSVEEDSIVWDIGRMNVGESKTLKLSAKVLTESVGKIKSGVTSATYSAEATVSRARFERVSGSGRQFSYVNAKEDDRPGVWHCKCVFENKSSFVVALSGATVKLIGREEPILDVSDIRQDVPPEGRWDSMSKRVESDDQPSFTQEIRFSILPRVSVESTGLIELKEQNLTVLDAVLQKRYDKSRIKSYVSSKIESTITFENTGTSEINVVRILDDIPGIFETPSLDGIAIEMEGSELSDQQYRIDVVNGIQIEEKHISPDNEGHGLRITVGTSAPLGLQPGKTLIIRYPLEAPDPSPKNKMLAAPIKVDFSCERFGPVATRSVERPPRLRVVHKRRNISTGKEVFPGGKPGQYEILLMFHNNSDSALDDLALHDVVPGTFTIEESSVRSDIDGNRDASTTKESARDGTQVTWAIGRIQMDERVEVLYTIQGDPEAEYKVSDAQDFHGATFGDEVDDEPNIPEWIEAEPPTTDPVNTPEVIPDELDSDGVIEDSEDVDQDEIGTTEQSTENDVEEDLVQENISCPVCSAEVGIGSSVCQVCGISL